MEKHLVEAQGIPVQFWGGSLISGCGLKVSHLLWEQGIMGVQVPLPRLNGLAIRIAPRFAPEVVWERYPSGPYYITASIDIKVMS